MVKNYSLSRTGLEIYKTDKSNLETISSDDNSDTGLVLRNGNIKEIYYTSDMTCVNFEQDYEGLSSSGDVSFVNIDETRIYKGVKVCLKKGWESPNTNLKWDYLSSVLTGFITDQSYSTDKVNLKITGMDKLLDKKEQFSFTKTKRSVILKKMIQKAGLKASINVNGLSDDAIDYTNVTTSSSDSSSTGGEGEDIDALASKICNGISGELAKAKAIHQWLTSNITYKYYSCSHYSTAEQCLKNKSHLNCADTSRLTRALMSSAGLNATVVHGPNHFWTVVTINGKEYASDATSQSRTFNQVYKGLSYYGKTGDNPSC